MKFSSESAQKERGRGISPAAAAPISCPNVPSAILKSGSTASVATVKTPDKTPGGRAAVILATRESCWCSPWVTGPGGCRG